MYVYLKLSDTKVIKKFVRKGERATDWKLKRRFEHAHIIMKSVLRHGADANLANR